MLYVRLCVAVLQVPGKVWMQAAARLLQCHKRSAMLLLVAGALMSVDARGWHTDLQVCHA